MHQHIRRGEHVLEAVLRDLAQQLDLVAAGPDLSGVLDVGDRAGDAEGEPGPPERPGRDLPALERRHHAHPEHDGAVAPVPARVEPVGVDPDRHDAHPARGRRPDPGGDSGPEPLGERHGMGRAAHGAPLEAVPPLAAPVGPVEPVAGVAGVDVREAGPAQAVRHHGGAGVEDVVRDRPQPLRKAVGEPVLVRPAFGPDLVDDGHFLARRSQGVRELRDRPFDAAVAGRRDRVDPGPREDDAHSRRTHVPSKRVPTASGTAMRGPTAPPAWRGGW